MGLSQTNLVSEMGAEMTGIWQALSLFFGQFSVAG